MHIYRGYDTNDDTDAEAHMNRLPVRHSNRELLPPLNLPLKPDLLKTREEEERASEG